MIVKAAIRYGKVICTLDQPARHHDILRELANNSDKQGFITDTGEFLTRAEAYKHAVECGQGTPRRDEILRTNLNAYNGKDLYSEDLW